MTTPPRRCGVRSAAVIAAAPPCETPMRRILDGGTPARTSASMSAQSSATFSSSTAPPTMGVSKSVVGAVRRCR